MTPHPKISPATGGVGRKRPPATGRHGNLGLALSRLAEQKPESWPGGTKLSCRRHRQVQLQRLRKQEHPVGDWLELEVGKLHRVELVDQRARPVIEHVSHQVMVGDAERKVHVGEAVAPIDG
jgi:hypothetical protein